MIPNLYNISGMVAFVTPVNYPPGHTAPPFATVSMLVSHSLEHLHYYARQLGFGPAWFVHFPGKMPYYKLTQNMRTAALSRGAMSINHTEVCYLRSLFEGPPAARTPSPAPHTTTATHSSRL
jgi:hypothetical protein